MGILSRFFKKSSKVEPESLPAASSPRKREARVNVLPLHRVSFNRTEPPESNPIQVANISSHGIGFFRNTASTWPKLGAVIRGVLTIGARRFELSLRVAYISNQIVGCAVETDHPSFSSSISEYFRTELVAQKMVKMKEDVILPTQEGIPHFVAGDNNCDFYYITRNNQLVFFDVTFFGNYVEGNAYEVTLVGTVEEPKVPDRPLLKGANLIHPRSRLSVETLDALLKFIENIQQVDPAIRSTVSSVIQTHHQK